MLNHRCSKPGCRARKTLKKYIDDYIRRPKCPSCDLDSLKYDPEPAKRHKKELCYCDGYHFLHRIGSKWCVYYQGELIDRDYKERYQCR